MYVPAEDKKRRKYRLCNNMPYCNGVIHKALDIASGF